MEGDKGTVCVTGGTGYIASWLIKMLLEKGYSIHATIRADPENKRDISFLTGLPGADKKLKLFRADLSDPDSFDAAIEGCKGVFHVASPMDVQGKEPEAVVTKWEIDGTIGILKACLKSQTVKKVVYTSSIAAVLGNTQDVDKMDESYWTDVHLVRKINAPGSTYAISKTLTERAATEFAAEHGLDLVTVVPPSVVGPFICPKLPFSVHQSLAPILGNQDVLMSSLNISMVHVDDLVRAQIFLLEHPSAEGRYICSSDTISPEKIAQILSTKYPEFLVPLADYLAEPRGIKMPIFSSKKLLDTGFKFNYGVEHMYDGAIKCCKEKGFL